MRESNILEGEILIHFGVLNKNERIYNRSEFTRTRVHLDGFGNFIEEYTILEELQLRADNNLLIGEFGIDVTNVVSLEKSTHLIKNIHIDEDYLYADIVPLKTKSEQCQLFTESIDNLVFRPRAIGLINPNDKTVDLIEMITFDAILKEEDAYNVPDKRIKKRKILTERYNL